jgi:hypothetical protein
MIEMSNIHCEETNDGWRRVVVEIKSVTFGNNIIWFSVPRAYQECLTYDRYDAFLVGILYPAMVFGEDITIKGLVSHKLYSNIMTYVQALLLGYSPGIKKIHIAVDGYAKQIVDTQYIGTGFSGGVDSFCTIYDHFMLEKTENYKINALLFLNVGSHGKYSWETTHKTFLSRYNNLSSYPQNMGLPFIPVDSNIHYYHENWGHQKIHSLTTIAGVLVLQNKFLRYFVASTISYTEMSIFMEKARNFDLSEYADPYLFPLLGTESLEFIPDGQQYTRSEKTVHIADYEPARKYLHVCLAHDDKYKGNILENCSVCNKCSRTLMTLESAGRLQDFSDVFDITKYRKKAFRYKCMQRVLYRSDVFAKDNVDFARKNGSPIPPLAIAILVYFFTSYLWLFAKKTLRVIIGNDTYKKLKKMFTR